MIQKYPFLRPRIAMVSRIYIYIYIFNVAVDSNVSQKEPVEQDIIRNRCAASRKSMRDRPRLSVKDSGEPMSYGDVASGVQPPYVYLPILGLRI